MEEQRGPDSNGVARDGGDERLFEGRCSANEAKRWKGFGAWGVVAKVCKVVACGEISAGAGEDNGAHRVVSSRRFEGCDQCAIHFAVERILLFGSIHQQAQNPLLSRNDDLFRHAGLRIGYRDAP